MRALALGATAVLLGRPIHWGLWSLALHGWTEPIERVLVEVERRGVSVVAPMPGATFEPGRPEPLKR